MLPLYTVPSEVHDLRRGLMRGDRLIALLALGAGVGAALLVFGSNLRPAGVRHDARGHVRPVM